MSYRSTKLLRTAEGQSCVLCHSIGTTVACHSNQTADGKGIGCKASDALTAHLCLRCHNEIDGRTGNLTKEDKRALWDKAFKLTVKRWFDQGLVKPV